MNTYDYPVGADDDNAPWNQPEQSKKEIDVTVSITLSKTVTVEVEDCSETSIREAVRDQITMPHELAVFIRRMFEHDLDLKAIPKYLKMAIEDSEDWYEDDFQVICE